MILVTFFAKGSTITTLMDCYGMGRLTAAIDIVNWDGVDGTHRGA